VLPGEPALAEPEAAAAPEPEPVPAEPEPVAAQPAEASNFFAAMEARRTQAAHLGEIARKLVLPDSALKEGTDALISRLEMRLKVMEHSIADLEARHSASAAESENRVRPVSDMVAELQQSAQGLENKFLHALGQVRLDVHELSTRLAGTDAPHSDVPGVAQEWPMPEAAAIPEAPKLDAITDGVAEPEEAAKSDQPQRSYLSDFRNLAREGARQLAEQENLHQVQEQAKRRQIYIAAGIAALCLVLVGALALFAGGPRGVSAAQSKAMPDPKSASVAATRDPAISPLDRLTALADKSDPRAELVVGFKYLSGDGVAANDGEAAKWLSRAAQKGEPVAENALGTLYQEGKGVDADPVQALRWYEAAAIQGNRHAMSNLAVLYANGAAGQKNFAEAARWFERSASLGYVDAQFDLAVLFERGDGVPQSLLDAYKWYGLAARAGDPVAKARMQAIATQITPDELQAAERAVAEFRPLAMNRAANDAPSMADVLSRR